MTPGRPPAPAHQSVGDDMSNIYEAREQACREKTEPVVAANRSLQAKVTGRVSLDAEMAWLHHQVESLLSSSSHRLIQFIASRRGEGVSTIVRELAKVAVERYGKSVLVLDSAYHDPGQRLNINVTCEYGWLDAMEDGKFIDKACFRVGESNLYFAPISVQASLVSPLKDLPMTVNLWEKLKEKFDLIIVDSSSDANISDSIVMSGNVDGVILVVEAEKTRRQVVESLKNRVITGGGTILGVVFNKRRHYIPEFLYRKI